MDKNTIDILIDKKNIIRPVLFWETNNMNYSELFNASFNLSNKIGDIENNKIIILNNNKITTIIALFAIWFVGKTAVLIDNYNKKNLKSLCNFFETNTIFSDEIEEIEYNNLNLNMFKITVDTSAKKYTENTNYLNCDEAIILSTSGSTNNPRYVVITHKNILITLENLKLRFKINKKTHELVIFPLSSVSSLITQILAVIYVGGSLTLYNDKFIPKKIFNIIVEKQITITGLTPTALNICTRNLDISKYNLSNLEAILVGGEKASREVMNLLSDSFCNTKIVQSYGLTETCGMITGGLIDDYPIESVGKIFDNTEIKILNENKIECKDNELGEIWIKGEQVTFGYYKNSILNKEVFFEDGILTGDIGYIDKFKNLYITSRKKNVIIISGKKIFPEEVEECIMQIPEVKNVVVYNGDTIKKIPQIWAQIELYQKKCPINEIDIMKICMENLPPYKCPKKIILTESINLVGMGKKRRYDI